MNALNLVRAQFAAALASMTPQAEKHAALVTATADPKHGDYQANCAMPLAKELGVKPRDIAQKIVEALPKPELFSSVEIAGPGFVNVRLNNGVLTEALTAALRDDRLGVPLPAAPKTMVIDYSSPNVAKPMHVGHLRSTIIGDALARIHRALGWKVVADNHLGDWGLQFGMLIHGWKTQRDHAAAAADPLAELLRIYRLVSAAAKTDPAVAEACRQETAKLQAGDAENLDLWRRIMAWGRPALDAIYQRLGVRFDTWFGESHFEPMMPAVVELLKAKGVAVDADGAVAVFFPDPAGAVDAEGNPKHLLPKFVVKKSDGAHTYGTSDLACIQFRLKEYRPDVMAYVVDARQSDHFKQLFATAARMGISGVRLAHVAFGTILGPDNTPLKTRDGETPPLAELLDEGVARARALIDGMGDADVPDAERQQVAEAIGLGAIKFADLSQNRESDYRFDLGKMIALDGFTAPYLQYAYARNRSIFRKGDIDAAKLRDKPPALVLEHPSERALALKLVRYPEALEAAAADFRPNVLCLYLYELAEAYSAFFRDCRVLQAESLALTNSRLALCELTARTMAAGLACLGIATVERM